MNKHRLFHFPYIHIYAFNFINHNPFFFAENPVCTSLYFQKEFIAIFPALHFLQRKKRDLRLIAKSHTFLYFSMNFTSQLHCLCVLGSGTGGGNVPFPEHKFHQIAHGYFYDFRPVLDVFSFFFHNFSIRYKKFSCNTLGILFV